MMNAALIKPPGMTSHRVTGQRHKRRTPVQMLLEFIEQRHLWLRAKA